ncbi:MAG: CaiB/BaiF CoA transferase family protein [Bacillota bacterium]
MPLSKYRVLDLTRMVSGPFCTMLLGDMGAEIIKVEPPGGDDTRLLGPPFINGHSAMYLSLNRNKKSIVLDLTQSEGQKVFLQLATEVDVVVENFRPGITSKLGIDYDAVHRANPRAIYCSLTAFGQTGPYRDKPGLDLVFQAMSGLMSITGEPEGKPIRAGAPIVDTSSGIMAALAVVSALLKRETTGCGEQVNLAMLDIAIALQAPVCSIYFASGENPERLGSASHFAFSQDLKTSDNYITVSAPNQKLWRVFCKAIGAEELLNDPRYNINEGRVVNRHELTRDLEKIITKRPTSEWLEVLEAAGVSCGPVNTYREVFNDPQVMHRQMAVTLEDEVIGKFQVTGNPIRFSGNSEQVNNAPPLLGEHTFTVLAQDGYLPEQLKELVSRGVINKPHSDRREKS